MPMPKHCRPDPTRRLTRLEASIHSRISQLKTHAAFPMSPTGELQWLGRRKIGKHCICLCPILGIVFYIARYSLSLAGCRSLSLSLLFHCSTSPQSSKLFNGVLYRSRFWFSEFSLFCPCAEPHRGARPLPLHPHSQHPAGIADVFSLI